VNFHQRAFVTKEQEHKVEHHLDCALPSTAHQDALMVVNYMQKVQGIMIADWDAGVPTTEGSSDKTR